LTANTALAGVLIGTPVTPALAADSLIIANATANGDILIAGNDGGHSRTALFFDASTPDTILYNVGGTWTAGATTWTIPAHTWGGAVACGDQNMTGVGDITLQSGTTLIDASGDLTISGSRLVSDTAKFNTSIVTGNAATMNPPTGTGYYFVHQAYATGVGLQEVARIAGATVPYFGLGSATGHVGIRTEEVTKAHNSDLFDATDVTDSVTIWQQPAGSVLLGVKIKMTAQFTSTGSLITDLDVTIGLAGDNDGLLAPTMNLTSDAVNSVYKTRGAYWDTSAEGSFWYSHAAEDWIAYATAVGANLSTTTAGSITFCFTYLDIP